MNKKLIALVLAFALVFSSFSAAFAETAIPADAQAAKDLGMLVGNGNGVTVDYLKENPTRLTAALMFLRLQGLESAALSYTGTENFADAKDVAWAQGRNVMAYLKANKQLGWVGTTGNMFKPNDKIDAQSYYKVMLEALGYKANTTEVIGDFTWNEVFTFAASKGLTKVAGVTNFVVNDIATATMEALKAKVAGSTTRTLAVKLVEAGVIDATKAAAAGVYVKPVVALEVASVTALNLKQVLVTFNREIEATSAVAAANYTYTGTTTIAARELQADKKSVLITLTGNEAQQAAATLKVENVKDAANVVVTTVTKTVTFFDAAIPTVVSAKVTAPTKVQIKFSEPVTATAFANTAFILDNNTYSLSGAPALVAGTVDTVEITLGATIPAGEHTIKINPTGTAANNQVKDFAGYVMATAEVKFTYAADTTAPIVTLKEATQTSATFEFNKAVAFAGAGVINTDLTVYHTYNNQASYKGVATLGADNKTLTVTFAAPIAPGSVTFYINNSSTVANTVRDNWGNVFAAATVQTTVSTDTTAPTVTKVEKFDSTHIDVTFSEAVQGVQASDFTLKDSANATVAVTGAVNTTGNTYRLTTATLNGNTYTLAIAADSITDMALIVNKIAAYTTTITVADSIAPTVTATGSFTADGKKVFVSFDEKMATTGAGSVLDVNNYRLVSATGTNPSALPTGTVITLGADEKSVIITFAAAETGLGAGDKAAIAVGQVRDLAGNATTSLTNVVAISPAALVAANISNVKAISRNVITFEVNSNLSAIDVTKFTIDGVAATAATYINNAGKSTVTVTAPANQWATDISDLAANAVVIAANGITNDNNIANSAIINVTGAKDYIVPTIVSRTVSDLDTDLQLDTVVITFSEALQVSSVAYDAFTVEGYTVTNVVAAGNTVTLTLAEKTTTDIGATLKVQMVKSVRDNSAQFNVVPAETAATNVQ